jgi:hypothetical protein
LPWRDAGAHPELRKALSDRERARLEQSPEHLLLARLALLSIPKRDAQGVLLSNVVNAI